MTSAPSDDRRAAAGPRRRAIRGGLLLAVGLVALLSGALLWWRLEPPRAGLDGASHNPSPLPQPQSAATAEPALPPAELRPVAKPPLDQFPGWKRSTNAPFIAQLLDNSLSLKSRRQAAHALARAGSEEAIAALRQGLLEGPPYLKAGIGEALGESPNPQARSLLLDLANGPDETAARGALRGFALRGDADAAEVLTEVLFNADKPESLRTEAALALGEVPQPGALAALTRAATELQDESISEQVLEGLGRRPFAETQEFFRDYLNAPGTSVDSKVAALEALSGTEGEVGPFLLKYAGDSDPELRAAAAWALSSTELPADLSPQLLELLKQEANPEVRTRLYQALANQEAYDVPAILALAQKEADPAARLAGLNLLAAASRSSATPDLLSFFNQTAVPELKNTALTSENPQDRLSAVMTLRRAGTPDSTGALQDIAGHSSDRNVVEAAQAVPRK